MAYTTIDDSSAYFTTALYTGNGNSGKNIPLSSANYAGEYVGATIAPDLVWIKNLAEAASHVLTDTTRGATKSLFSDQNGTEETEAQQLTAFGSDDFTLGTSNNVNDADEDHIAWIWKANGGTRTTNAESGNNPAGGYQASTTAGFSIVDYTGTGSAGTMAHGLGAVPTCMLVKNRDESSTGWGVYHQKMSAAGNDSYLQLNATGNASTAGTMWNDTTPTSSVFTVGSNARTNKDGVKYIAYVFTPIQGYSRFGSYEGNNNATMFVYTGFKPTWFMVKNVDSTATWRIYTNYISNQVPHNDLDRLVYANSNEAESGTGHVVDFVSNGVQIRGDNEDVNDADTYIYLAFAENPFVTSGGVPATAR